MVQNIVGSLALHTQLSLVLTSDISTSTSNIRRLSNALLINGTCLHSYSINGVLSLRMLLALTVLSDYTEREYG